MRYCKRDCYYNKRGICRMDFDDMICFHAVMDDLFGDESDEPEKPKEYAKEIEQGCIRVTNINGKEYVPVERYVNLLNNYHHLTEVIDSLKDEIQELETELSVKENLLKMRHGKCAVGEDGDILTCICPDCYAEVVARLPEGYKLYRLIKETNEKGHGK